MGIGNVRALRVFFRSLFHLVAPSGFSTLDFILSSVFCTAAAPVTSFLLGQTTPLSSLFFLVLILDFYGHISYLHTGSSFDTRLLLQETKLISEVDISTDTTPGFAQPSEFCSLLHFVHAVL